MADPITVIGAIASVVQLIDFSTEVLVRLNEYRKKGNELPSAFVHIDHQLPLLREILERTNEGITSQSIDVADVKAIEPCLRGCQQQMEKLKDILSAILPQAQEGTVKKLKKGLRSIWKESDVRRIDEEIEFYIIRLTFYCAWSSSRLDQRNQDMLVRIQQWLAPPDPFLNLRKSLKLRSKNTGKWYLQSAQYGDWKAGGAPFTWLHGSAGSGKTILSAAIIEDLQDYCNDDPARSLAFFFFDFNDAEKQDPSNMVKSLLSQFLSRCVRVPETVQAVHTACKNDHRQPSEQQLMSALKQTFELLPAPFIVLDALDECTNLDGLSDILEQMESWGKPALHVLMTSRRELEIEEMLEQLCLPAWRTSLESHVVDKDIVTFVREKLSTDKSFKRWQRDQNLKVEIEETLGRKACGMFRWAACQLDTIAQCVTPGKVRRALQDLPKTLNDTYARIICEIDEGQNAEEALKILRWLTYAERPLTTIELLEVTGIFIGEVSRFDEEEVLRDPNDILRICSSLVSITTAGEDSSGIDDGSGLEENPASSDDDAIPETEYVRLAHFSVKEYLVSSRPYIAKYSLRKEESHDVLASCCIVYLLRFTKDEWQRHDCESVFPLSRYAAEFWTQHARIPEAPSQRQRNLSMELLTQSAPAFEAWIRFCDISFAREQAPDIHRNITELPSALYAASCIGAVHAVYDILDDTVETIDEHWDDEGSALQVASYFGYEKIVEMLLAKGADVNAQGGTFCNNALEAATKEGYKKVVEMLLAKDADVNAQTGGHYDTALQTASARGYKEIVEMLLAKGANINAQGGTYGNSLNLATLHGHTEIVEMLLAKGADVKTQGGLHGNALQAATVRGHEKIMEMLLLKGADVNAQGGGFFSDALQSASARGDGKIVGFLLARGADIYAQGGSYGTALQVASSGGHAKIVEMLLARGADINAQGGIFGTALQVASGKGYKKIVEMLLFKGADVNAVGGRKRGSALHEALANGHESIGEMLLAKGASDFDRIDTLEDDDALRLLFGSREQDTVE